MIFQALPWTGWLTVFLVPVEITRSHTVGDAKAGLMHNEVSRVDQELAESKAPTPEWPSPGWVPRDTHSGCLSLYFST